MSAECGKCGSDLVYVPGNWPLGECPVCVPLAALETANKALDTLASLLELHAEELWQVQAHGIACAAWRVTEDALGRRPAEESSQ